MASAQRARIQIVNNVEVKTTKPFVAYWCYKTLRTQYNHSLQYAIYLANKHSMPLIAFCTVPTHSLPQRQGVFALQGIENVCSSFVSCEIQCHVLFGHISASAAYMGNNAAAMIVDSVYLEEDKSIYQQMKAWTRCRIIQVESNVVVPLCVASNKEEYAAATLRPKIHTLLRDYAQPIASLEIKNPSRFFSHSSLIFPKTFQVPHSKQSYEIQIIDPSQICKNHGIQGIRIDKNIASVPNLIGGEKQAQQHLQDFIQHKLKNYHIHRNDPSLDGQSHLSAYLRFGHISPVDITLRVLEASNYDVDAFLLKKNIEEHVSIYEDVQAFLEELIVRRELAHNFIFYNSSYKTYSAAIPQWAQKTLLQHKADKRIIVYSFDAMENARTEDDYWNAAQIQMKRSAYMHGYMRMYWAKKILEWTEDPEEAFLFSIAQNDRYQMDGTDPNGYTGLAWCYGKHDRPWFERPIFGTVRYMNAHGIRRKYKNIDTYIQKWLN